MRSSGEPRRVLLGTLVALTFALAVLGEGVARAAPIEPVRPEPPTVEPPRVEGVWPSPSPGASDVGIRIRSDDPALSRTVLIILLLTVGSVAPAILLLMTSFTRYVVVLALARNGLGLQGIPPNQVLIGLALFMTFLIMAPTWQRVNSDALQPYMAGEIDQMEALRRAQQPVRDFMFAQVERNGNNEDIFLMARFAGGEVPTQYSQVGTMTLVPAFMLSELKTAFLIGFKVYLPFLVIDMVVSAVLISMGMMMLPPVMISLPFKLLLFVLVDGWHLITGSLVGSFMV